MSATISLLAHIPTTYTELGYLLLALIGVIGAGMVALDATNLWLAPATPQVLQQRRHSILLLRAAGMLISGVLAFVAAAVFLSTLAYR